MRVPSRARALRVARPRAPSRVSVPTTLLLLLALTPPAGGAFFVRVSKPSELGPYNIAADSTAYILAFNDVVGVGCARAAAAASQLFTSCSQSSTNAAYVCTNALQYPSTASFSHTAAGDFEPWLQLSSPNQPLDRIIFFPRTDCCWTRNSNVTVETRDPSGAVTWGTTLGAVTSSASFSVEIPQFSIRLSKLPANGPYADSSLSVAEVAVFSSRTGTGASRTMRGACRQSSTSSPWTRAFRCDACADGNLATSCVTNATDPSPWYVVGVADLTPVGSIVITPSAGGWAARAAGVLVELLVANTGVVLWSATMAPTSGGNETFVLPPLKVLRISKPGELGPYPASEVLNGAEVAGYGSGGVNNGPGNSPSQPNTLLYHPGWQSTFLDPLLYPFSCAVDGSVASNSFFHTVASGAEWTPWIAIALYPNEAPITDVTITARPTFNSRNDLVSVDILSGWPDAPLVQWGATAGAIAPLSYSFTLPTFVLRVTRPSSNGPFFLNEQFLQFAELGAFSFGSATNRATGGACRAGSVYDMTTTYRCAAGVDGSTASIYHSNMTDTNPWFVVSLAGGDAVASVTFLPRQDILYLERYVGIVIDLLYAATGELVWTTTLAQPASKALLTFPIARLPYMVRISKFSLYGPYVNTLQTETTPAFLNIAEVTATGAAGVNVLANRGASASTTYGSGQYPPSK